MTTRQQALISIYDAALSERNWARALDACSDVMNATAALAYQVPASGVVDYRMDAASTYFRSFPGFFEDYNRMVAAGGGSEYDLEGMSYVHSRSAFQARLDSAIYDLDHGYFDRPEVSYVSRVAGLTRRCAVNLSDDPVGLTGVLFFYDRDFGENEGAALQDLQQGITPHLARSLEIHRFTHELRQKYNAVLSVLDRISTGVLVVSRNGDVIVRNATASQVLGENAGLSETRTGRLTADTEAADAALKRAVAEVSSTAIGENDKPGAIVEIPRRSSGISLIAVVSPLRDADMEIDKGLVGALITIIDSSRPMEVQSGLVSIAYGLTKAEARVAGFVLQGLSNAEISDRAGVGPETIKSQISSILAKSGCKSRTAFIWRVYQLSPPVN